MNVSAALCTAAAVTAAMIPATVVPASADTGAMASSARAQAQAQALAPLAPLDPVVVVDCFSQARMRPTEYLLACGDGNNRLVDLRWDTWGTRTATAVGTDMVNDCVPYCAAGRFRAYPVTVTLSRPEAWPEHPDVQRFTTIRLLYTDTAPAPAGKDVTYSLDY